MSTNNYPFRNISIHARDSVLEAIVARAADRKITLAKAAVTLIEDGLGNRPVDPELVNLEKVSTDDLIGEVVGRLQAAQALADAIERAERAEARLLAVASALGSPA